MSNWCVVLLHYVLFKLSKMKNNVWVTFDNFYDHLWCDSLVIYAQCIIYKSFIYESLQQSLKSYW